jgi:integrase/recombinase XerD
VYLATDTLKSARSQRGTPFAQNTKHDYVKVLKPFLLWLIEYEYSSLPEKKVQKIKRPPKNTLARRQCPKCCTVCGRVLNLDGRT